MQLDCFLNNKFPGTNENWTQELISVATQYDRLDGKPYNHEELENLFVTMSRRAPNTRDETDFRDEYGAYMTFLGLMYLEKDGNQWICRTSPKSKELLCGELPDPQAFLRFQFSMFQYPNPIGIRAYNNGTLRTVWQALDKRLEQISQGIQVVPLRLFLRVLLALSQRYGVAQAYLSYKEIWKCLFCEPEAIGNFTPDGDLLAEKIMRFRSNPLPVSYPSNALRNLHILRHTGLFDQATSRAESHILRLRADANNPETIIGNAARTIASMTTFFPTPTPGASKEDVEEWTLNCFTSGDWASYYGGNSTTYGQVNSITQSVIEIDEDLISGPVGILGVPLHSLETNRQYRSRRGFRRIATIEETEALRESESRAQNNPRDSRQ